MAEAYETRVRSLRRLIKLYDTEITKLDVRIAAEFKGHVGYQAIQAICGIGPVIAATLTAELGDVTRAAPGAVGGDRGGGQEPRHRPHQTALPAGR